MENVININKIVNSRPQKKRVTISSKRQITIPQAFFKKLGFSDYAECYVEDDKLIICPEKKEGSEEMFGDLVLEELIAKGLSGQKLLNEYRGQMRKISEAVYAVKQDAAKVAEGQGKYYTVDEVFGEEDN